MGAVVLRIGHLIEDVDHVTGRTLVLSVLFAVAALRWVGHTTEKFVNFGEVRV